MSYSQKRLEELQRAHERLKVLVNATVLVAMDSAASEFIRHAEEVHSSPVHTADDLQQRVTLALAGVKAEIGALTGEVPS